MRLREWVRRGRVTTPTPVLPVMVVCLVVTLVGHVAIVWIVGLIAIAWFIVSDPAVVADWRLWAGLGAEALFAPVVFIGWWAVRLLVSSWVRAQPPEPPRG